MNPLRDWVFVVGSDEDAHRVSVAITVFTGRPTNSVPPKDALTTIAGFKSSHQGISTVVVMPDARPLLEELRASLSNTGTRLVAPVAPVDPFSVVKELSD